MAVDAGAGGGGEAGPSGAAGSKKRFEVKKWNAVAVWSWRASLLAAFLAAHARSSPLAKQEHQHRHVRHLPQLAA